MKNTLYSQSRPLTVSSSTESLTYILFAIAIALTAVGFYVGGIYASYLTGMGLHMVFLVVQLAILVTSGWWSKISPLNMILFAVFPILSGIAIAPFISSVMIGYSNGPAIVVNALSGTAFMALAAGVFAKTTSLNLGVIGKALFLGLLGIIGLYILQFFVPALRTDFAQMLISGFGIVLFAAFIAYDVQRIQRMGAMGASPFSMALSLYLSIYNLFTSVLRFMLVMSGDR
jgi:modulator of FtsH protease